MWPISRGSSCMLMSCRGELKGGESAKKSMSFLQSGLCVDWRSTHPGGFCWAITPLLAWDSLRRRSLLYGFASSMRRLPMVFSCFPHLYTQRVLGWETPRAPYCAYLFTWSPVSRVHVAATWGPQSKGCVCARVCVRNHAVRRRTPGEQWPANAFR